MTWIVEDKESGNTTEFDTRGNAEDRMDELEGLVDAELYEKAASDGGTVDVVDDEAQATVEPTPTADDIPQSTDVAEDPVSWMPSHFIDHIEGVPAINRKGYAVLAEHYDISVTAEAVTYPSKTDFEYAEFEAVAVTEDGKEYSGFGSAHVERGDDKTLLGELAETRACKRSLALATGVGMTAVSELQHSLGENQ